MQTFIHKAKEMYNTMEEELNHSNLRYDHHDTAPMAYHNLMLVYNHLAGLKFEMYNYINDGIQLFENEEEEILFFKEIKPKFLCRMIYYTKVNEIMVKWPAGSQKIQQGYLEEQMNKIQHYFFNNREFYVYYRNGNTQMDQVYFKRHNTGARLSLDYLVLESDENFSTGFDIIMARILANDQLQVFLEKQKVRLNNTMMQPITSIRADAVRNISWTASKTDLVELLYALHYQGALNNGNATLKEIANCLQKTFGVDLGGSYHTYLEMKERKTGYTKFLDELKKNLQKKMEQAIENA
jgi:RteC protein